MRQFKYRVIKLVIIIKMRVLKLFKNEHSRRSIIEKFVLNFRREYRRFKLGNCMRDGSKVGLAQGGAVNCASTNNYVTERGIVFFGKDVF